MKRRHVACVGLLIAAAVLGMAGFAPPGVSGQTGTLVRLTPRTQQVQYDDGAFTIEVNLSNLNHHGTIDYDTNRDTVPDRQENSDGLGAYELKLNFDPGIVRVTDMDAGEFLRDGGRSTQCLRDESTAGEYALGCVSFGDSNGPQGSGNLAVLTLEPVSNGMSYLALTAGLAGPLGDSISVGEVQGGVLEVSGGPDGPPDDPDDPDDPDGPDGPSDNTPGGPGPSSSDGTPLVLVPAQETATAETRATAIALGTPADYIDGDGTPSATATLPNTGGDGDGSNLTPWIIGIVVAAVTAITLLVASRFVLAARRP